MSKLYKNYFDKKDRKKCGPIAPPKALFKKNLLIKRKWSIIH